MRRRSSLQLAGRNPASFIRLIPLLFICQTSNFSSNREFMDTFPCLSPSRWTEFYERAVHVRQWNSCSDYQSVRTGVINLWSSVNGRLAAINRAWLQCAVPSGRVFSPREEWKQNPADTNNVCGTCALCHVLRWHTVCAFTRSDSSIYYSCQSKRPRNNLGCITKQNVLRKFTDG